MISGTIYLYDRSGSDVIDERKYKCPKERKTIIDLWKSLYGEGFEKCIIQVSPEVNVLHIAPDGTNTHNSGKVSVLNKWAENRKKLAKEDLGRT